MDFSPNKILIHAAVFFMGYHGKGCSRLLPTLFHTGLCHLESCFLKEDAVTPAIKFPNLNAIKILIKNLNNLKRAK